MAICKGILLLLVTVAISTVSCDSSFSPSDSNEILRNIIVTDSNVLLGSSDRLYRLSLDLQQQERRQLDTPNRLLVTDPDGTYAGLVFTCGTSTCSLSNIQDLSDIRWQVSSGVVGPDTENVAGIIAPGPNGTSSLTFGQREYFNNFAVTSTIGKGDLISVNSPGNDSFGVFAYQEEADNRRERRFLTAFSYKNYVYFVSTLQISFDDVEVRVFRFCHEDQGISAPFPWFASRYEIVLQCSSEDANGPIVGYSAAFVDSAEPFGTESILLGFVGTAMDDQIVDYACNYSLDEINRQINQTLEACLGGPGENDENVIGFTREDDVIPCRSTTVNVKECSLFGFLSAGLEVKDPLTVTAFLYDAETGKGFTSIVYTSVDSYSFLFAGTSEGTLHQFYIQSPTEATKVRDISLDTSSEITKLLASNDGETIYALTSKKVTQVPLEECSTFTDCGSCINHGNPLCGWCTVEEKCSRRSQCQNATGTMRWEQNITECIDVTTAVGLNLINNSPIISGNTISADIRITGTPKAGRVVCALTGLPHQDCSSGSVVFTDIPARENNRPYILRITAKSTDGLRTVIRRKVRLELPGICTVHLINDGITVSGDSATVEFANTGPATSFKCSIDRQAFTSCRTGETFTGLTPGEHRIKISPSDCGQNRHPMMKRFIVEEELPENDS